MRESSSSLNRVGTGVVIQQSIRTVERGGKTRQNVYEGCPLAVVAGPAVAGGMELAMWADGRVMEQSAYMGVYCRRWGIPFIDGGTVRLPRLVGEGRALDPILTGRQFMADECERIGLCEYVVPEGEARTRAEELAHQIAQFPPPCARADRRSVKAKPGLNLRDALAQEWYNSRPVLEAEGIEGAGRFSSGDGRHGIGTPQPSRR